MSLSIKNLIPIIISLALYFEKTAVFRQSSSWVIFIGEDLSESPHVTVWYGRNLNTGLCLIPKFFGPFLFSTGLFFRFQAPDKPHTPSPHQPTYFELWCLTITTSVQSIIHIIRYMWRSIHITEWHNESWKKSSFPYNQFCRSQSLLIALHDREQFTALVSCYVNIDREPHVY